MDVNAVQLTRSGSTIQMTLRTGEGVVSKFFESMVETLFKPNDVAGLACLDKFDNSEPIS